MFRVVQIDEILDMLPAPYIINHTKAMTNFRHQSTILISDKYYALLRRCEFILAEQYCEQTHNIKVWAMKQISDINRGVYRDLV